MDIMEAAGAASPMGNREAVLKRIMIQVTGILTKKVADMEWAKQTTDFPFPFKYALILNTKLVKMQSME